MTPGDLHRLRIAYTRAKGLYKAGLISGSAVSAARKAYQDARAELDRPTPSDPECPCHTQRGGDDRPCPACEPVPEVTVRGGGA